MTRNDFWISTLFEGDIINNFIRISPSYFHLNISVTKYYPIAFISSFVTNWSITTRPIGYSQNFRYLNLFGKIFVNFEKNIRATYFLDLQLNLWRFAKLWNTFSFTSIYQGASDEKFGVNFVGKFVPFKFWFMITKKLSSSNQT